MTISNFSADEYHSCLIFIKLLLQINQRSMNNAILVPTDLSVNSKAGIRFALQLARQSKRSLVFLNCIQLLKPTRWSEATYNAYVEKELETAQKMLDKFIRGISKSTGSRGPRTQNIVMLSADVQKSIIDTALDIKAQAICMSTRGAGRLKKMIGTNASGIIHNSPVPVFVVPKNYRTNPITHILYSSDLSQLATELKEVSNFSKMLKAKVTVVHYDYLADVDEARLKLEKVAKRFKRPGVAFRFQKFNIDKSLGQHLVIDMKKSKASLAALFTDQKRGWFDKLFLSSRSEAMAFDSKIPLLVFPKA